MVACASIVLVFAFATNALAQSADLAVTKTGPATVTAGTNITYTVTVANNGPNDAQNVKLSDALPPGTTFVSEAQASGPAFTCSNPPSGGTGSVGCTLATFAAGQSGSFVIVYQVGANLANGTTITNTAQISSSTADPTTADNTSSVSSIVNTPLARPPVLTKSFGEVSILPGGTTSLTFNLTNPNTVQTLTGLQFSDTLPAGLVISTPNGLAGSCDGGTITAVAGTNVITLVNATLAPQASCTFSVNVTSTGAVLGFVTNTTSTVTSNEGVPGAPASATLFIGDPFQISYSSNLSFADSAINISNTGANASAVNPVTQALNGNLCVNVYAFSPDEQMVSCCSCHVTPNALWSLSARSELISNTLTPGSPTSVVIKLVATLAGPGGASGPGTAAAPTCNPATIVPSGPAGAANSLALGLTAWSTTIHALGPSAVLPPGGTTPPAGTALGLTETEFTRGTLSAAELTRLTTLCGFIQGNGSGFGICKSCRFGGLTGISQ